MDGTVFERIFLPIVYNNYSKNKEAKASEVPIFIGTENEREDCPIPCYGFNSTISASNVSRSTSATVDFP